MNICNVECIDLYNLMLINNRISYLTQNIIKCKKIIKFGGKKLCQLHMPNEYKLAKFIKENSRNNLDQWVNSYAN